jgi:CRP/FNR family transcriptional regulator
MKDLTTSYNQHCAQCGISNLCLTVGLSAEDIQQIDNAVNSQQLLHKGDYLFHSDDQFSYIYAVRSGSFKTFTVDKNDKTQINGFYLVGELMGFAAIACQRYQYSAVALETSSVCAVPYKDLFELAQKLPNLQRQVLSLMSQQLSPVQQNFLHMTAEQRLGQFLLSLSSRMKRRGLSATEFRLSMSHQDIANYLGLAAETLSRVFKQMQDEQLIALTNKTVVIKNLTQLVELL